MAKPKPVKVLKSRVVFHGPIFDVVTEQVREPNGRTSRRDTVRHPGSAVVMPVDDTGRVPRVLLIRQYRYPANQHLWEFSAGRIDEGETALAAAKRELLEETGFVARQWKRALRFYASPGFLDETMELFVARGLTRGLARPEADEDITARFFPLAAAARMAQNGRIRDSKTLAGIFWLQLRPNFR